jgi:ATP-binding cassette subfamily B protein
VPRTGEREDSAFGEDEPDMALVQRAAEIADAAGFIESMALAYDTKVGDSGMRLSGGQAQRVCIARALYHDPPVLPFDEATSALDTESEAAVKRNLDRVLEDRTAVIVAHRPSTIRDADVIAVLEQGRIVEHGSHDELLDRQGCTTTCRRARSVAADHPWRGDARLYGASS